MNPKIRGKGPSITPCRYKFEPGYVDFSVSYGVQFH